MAKYKAFISYRRTHSESAELIKSKLVEEYGFSTNEIFLDTHDIGPEYFDTRLKTALMSSSALVLVITNDCFVPNEGGEDWYLEEIQTALDNEITIIPILFDNIKNLSSKKISSQLEQTFNDKEIEKLTKSQSIKYDPELSKATFIKLSEFLIDADKPDFIVKLFRIAKCIGLIVAVISIIFTLFLGVGFLWGYISFSTEDEDILVENTRIEGKTAIFEFGGLEATYDVLKDSVFIDLENFKGEIPQSDFEILAHSCSVSGAVVLFNKNMSALKYFKFLKGGSKPSKYALAGITAATCIGSFCGFSQGSKFARILRQQELALALFPKLRNKNLWHPVFQGTPLYVDYIKSRKGNVNLYNLINQSNKAYHTINAITWCSPHDEIHIAHDAGLKERCILCKYNGWEIGKGTAKDLSDEIEKSKLTTKDVIILEINTERFEFKRIKLPSGTVGIMFDFPTDTVDITPALNAYKEWKTSI